MRMTRADIAHGVRRAESLRARLANVRKKTEKVTETAVHTLEVGASAFGFGALHGYNGTEDGVQVVGIPIELLAAVGLHGAGFLGLGGKASSHLHGVADGALASYATRLGYSMGTKWSSKAPGGGTGVLETAHRNRFVGKGADSLSADELVQAGEAVPA